MKKIGFTMGVGGGGGGSTEYTQAEKTKLAGIEAGATVGATAAQAAKLTELEGSIGNVVNGTTPVKLASALTETKVSDTYEYGTTARTTATTYAGCEIDKIYGKAVVVGEGDSARVDGCTPKQKVVKDANGVVKHTIEMPKSLGGEYLTLYGIGTNLDVAHDYIDWERKVVVRKVGSVKLNELSWAKSDYSFYTYFKLKYISDYTPSFRGKCAKYRIGSMHDLQQSCVFCNGNENLQIIDSSYTSVSGFTASLTDNDILYYEIATPYEEPILCSSSVHEVVAGGTETMVYVGASPTVVSEYSGSADAMKLHQLELDKLLTREEANRTFLKTGGCDAYVDLGLPSGTLWAKCNLGATSETEAGDYYGWGMTSPYRIGIDSTDSYEGSTASQIQTDLPLSADCAFQKLGAGWRIPSKEQFEELIANTTQSNASIGGVLGKKFTSSNGMWIFLPYAGGYSKLALYSYQTDLRYGMSTIKNNSSGVYDIEGNESQLANVSSQNKHIGLTIRPVFTPLNLR